MIESSDMTSSDIPAYQMIGLGLVNITSKFAFKNIEYHRNHDLFFEVYFSRNFKAFQSARLFSESGRLFLKKFYISGNRQKFSLATRLPLIV